jgi:hypothetical protein
MIQKLWKFIWAIFIILTLYIIIGVAFWNMPIDRFTYEIAMLSLLVFEILMFSADIKIK